MVSSVLELYLGAMNSDFVAFVNLNSYPALQPSLYFILPVWRSGLVVWLRM